MFVHPHAPLPRLALKPLTRWGAALASAGAAVFFAASGTAAPLQLTWNAPPGCPSEVEVRHDVQRLVGVEPAALPALKASIWVTLRAGQWQLELTTQLNGSAGERALNGPSCQVVADAAAVILALMLNPEAKLEPAPDPARDQSVTSPAQSANRRSVSYGIEAYAGLSHGLLPDLAAQAGLGGHLGIDRVWLSLLASAALAQHASIAHAPEVGGELQLGSAHGAACFDPLGRRDVLGVCAGVQLHRIHGRGTGINEPENGAIHWVALGPSLVARMSVSSAWQVQARAEAGWAMARPRLYVEEVGQVHQPKAWSALIGLGAALRLE